jgi:hypothetical protein
MQQTQKTISIEYIAGTPASTEAFVVELQPLSGAVDPGSICERTIDFGFRDDAKLPSSHVRSSIAQPKINW